MDSEQSEMVVMEPTSQPWEGPKTHEEARCYHQGYIAGLTAYARETGQSTLRTGNELLRRLMDDQGWATIETFERLPVVSREELLFEAIKKHHDQKADDRCIMDDTELYAAAGLEPADHHVGDKAAMLRNCERFVDNRCQSGGPWQSYAELEAERDRLQAELKMWKPMTTEEAEAALEAAVPVPISDEEIAGIVERVTDPAYRPPESEYVLMAAKIRQQQQELDRLRATLDRIDSDDALDHRMD